MAEIEIVDQRADAAFLFVDQLHVHGVGPTDGNDIDKIAEHARENLWDKDGFNNLPAIGSQRLDRVHQHLRDFADAKNDGGNQVDQNRKGEELNFHEQVNSESRHEQNDGGRERNVASSLNVTAKERVEERIESDEESNRQGDGRSFYPAHQIHKYGQGQMTEHLIHSYQFGQASQNGKGRGNDLRIEYPQRHGEPPQHNDGGQPD